MILSSLMAFLNELDYLGREHGWIKEVSVDDATRTITVRFLNDAENPVVQGTIHASYEAVFDNDWVDIYADTLFEHMLRSTEYVIWKDK